MTMLHLEIFLKTYIFKMTITLSGLSVCSCNNIKSTIIVQQNYNIILYKPNPIIKIMHNTWFLLNICIDYI